MLLATPAQAQGVGVPVAAARTAISLGLSNNLPVLGARRMTAVALIDPTIVSPQANVTTAAASQSAAALPPAPDCDHGTGTISGDDVVVRVGSVTTQNSNERGIDTVATGTTMITAGSVVTSGDLAGAFTRTAMATSSSTSQTL